MFNTNREKEHKDLLLVLVKQVRYLHASSMNDTSRYWEYWNWCEQANRKNLKKQQQKVAHLSDSDDDKTDDFQVAVFKVRFKQIPKKLYHI